MTTTISTDCGACGKSEAQKRCGRCKTVYYCSVDCQKQAWREHKIVCVMTTSVPVDMNQLTDESATLDEDALGKHKALFDSIVKKYNLFGEESAGEIADLLSQSTQENPVNASDFAQRYKMLESEAVLFLSWIKRGLSVI